jgi:hypothetical protein
MFKKADGEVESGHGRSIASGDFKYKMRDLRFEAGLPETALNDRF